MSKLHLLWTYFQIRSHSEVVEARTSIYEGGTQLNPWHCGGTGRCHCYALTQIGQGAGTWHFRLQAHHLLLLLQFGKGPSLLSAPWVHTSEKHSLFLLTQQQSLCCPPCHFPQPPRSAPIRTCPPLPSDSASSITPHMDSAQEAPSSPQQELVFNPQHKRTNAPMPTCLSRTVVSRSPYHPLTSPVCACSVAKLCLTLCEPTDCSPPGSAVHGILQARILEWVTIPSSRRSSQSKNPLQVDYLLSEPPGKSLSRLVLLL